MATTNRSRALLQFALFASFAPVAAAQCGLDFHPENALFGADGAVLASCPWDPDGVGPQPPVIVLAGTFQSVLGVVANGIALYDPATNTCAPLGTGAGLSPAGVARAVAVDSNNELLVGGAFSSIDGVAANNIARWDGAAWQPLAQGSPLEVRTIHVRANGEVFVGSIYSILSASVHRWDGSTWSIPGAGLGGNVFAFAELANGNLLAGGQLLLSGDISLAVWDGTTWSPFAEDTDGGVLAMQRLTSGEILVTGGFAHVGGVAANSVARWDGTSWHALGSGMPNPVFATCELPGGDLVVAGLFQLAGGVAANHVARWDGTAWHAMGNGLDSPTSSASRPVATLTPLAGGELLAGGMMHTLTEQFLARWDGTTWQQLRTGTNAAVHVTALAANGDLIAGGAFTTIEGVAANRVARRVGGVWQPLGAGVDGDVLAIQTLANGDIVIGGSFTTADGLAAPRVARWDGTAWHALGAGLPGTVRSFAVGPYGELLASGSFFDRVAVWDGTTWNGTGIAFASLNTTNRRLLATDGGVLAAIGPNLQGSLSRWDGFQWNVLSGGFALDTPLAELSNGDIVTSTKRWNGSTWTSLGSGSSNGTVLCMLALPNDDVLFGGSFTQLFGQPITGLARWDGTTWSQVGLGTNGIVEDLRWLPDGRVRVAGTFTVLDGVACAGLGVLETDCPATATAVGNGCVGSNGLVELQPVVLPWLDAPFTSRASGLPATSIVVELLGTTAVSVPLGNVLPQGGPGCTVTTPPDALRLYVPGADTLELVWRLPANPTVLGVVFRQQVVPFELDGNGAIVEATASNTLEATVGAF